MYVLANGTSEYGDSQSYLNYADALAGADSRVRTNPWLPYLHSVL